MNILLINSVNMQYRDIVREINTLPPLGLLYIATNLNKKRGYSVAIIDCFVQDIVKAELQNMLSNTKCLLVGISVFTESYKHARELAALIKSFSNNIKIVFGGAFSTFKYREILSNEPNIDYIVIGEGEDTILELAEYVLEPSCGKSLTDIKGIAFRKDSEIICTEARRPILDLDVLPFPDRTIIKKQLSQSLYSIPYTLNTSRGCPGDCIFCSSSSPSSLMM